MRGFNIIENGAMSGTLLVMDPYAGIKGQVISAKKKKLLFVLKGNVAITIHNKVETVGPGDSVYLKEEVPSLLKNKGGDSAEILLLSV
jgi:glyoxylate utilization-related uncharacterized protein